MNFRYWMVTTLGFLLAFSSGCHAAPVDQVSLTRDMAARISRYAPQAKVEIVGPLTLKLNGGTPQETQVNLDRIADFCSHNTAGDCEDFKVHFAAGVPALVTEHPVTRYNLRAVIRSPEYAAAMQEVPKAKKLPVFPLARGLVVMLAADSPKTTELVDTEAMATVTRDEKAALQLARTNVLAGLPKLPTAEELQKKRVVLLTGYDYVSSILLADGWSDLARTTNGALFVAVPGDNEVVVGLASNDETLKRLRVVVAQDYQSAERPVSPHIYRWAAKGWEVADGR